MKRTVTAGWLVLALGWSGCADEDADQAAARPDAGGAGTQVAVSGPGGATVYGNPRERLTQEQLEQGRLDPSWRRYAQLDSAAAASDSTAAGGSESWEDISPRTLNSGGMMLPLHGDVAGPSVARLQIALDRVMFSPGIIDGRWGKNTEKAVYWLQKREGIPATGRVDRRTWDRLVQLAGGAQGQFARAHQLTQEDVKGPFLQIPEDIYDKAELDCMCYESLSEKLAERFHTSTDLLSQLNPGVDLDGVRAGQTLQVPNVRDQSSPAGTKPAKLVISDGGSFLHALDGNGRILYHFPSTLGSDYAPSPSGDFRVTNIAPDPTWHYQPDLLTGVPDDEESAIIPPGPNNAVGVVWMQLSKPHYGIHGTSAPETIGYATSHGCVRLTNWDARFLSQLIEPGIPVEFRDVV